MSDIGVNSWTAGICGICKHGTMPVCMACGQCSTCCPKDCKRRRQEVSILDEAKQVRLDRSARADVPERNFERIARVWSVILGITVSAKQVALCMIALKLVRECFKPWRDNLVDICGYADCAAEVEGYYVEGAYGPVCGPGPKAESSDDCRREVGADGTTGSGGSVERNSVGTSNPDFSYSGGKLYTRYDRP